MFDFNGDGKTDIGEHFIGHEIYKDVTSGFGKGSPRRSQHTTRIDGITILIIGLFIWQLLTLIADLMY